MAVTASNVRRNRTWPAVRLGLLFISPWLAGFFIFTLYPIIASLYFSFCQYRVLTPPHWIGFQNYIDMFTDRDYFMTSLYNTFFMFIELPIALILAVAIALLLNQKVSGISVFRTIYYLPSVVPTVASAVLWLWVLNPQYGLINRTLMMLHLPTTEWLSDPNWAKPAFIIMDLWSIGGGVVIYLAALQSVPQHLLEAAELDGASSWQRTLHVTLPAISPVIFFNLILGVINTFQYFTQTFVMTSASPGGRGGPANSTLFYALYLFQNAFENFRMGYACAMAWFLFIITLVATLLILKTSARWVDYEGEER